MESEFEIIESFSKIVKYPDAKTQQLNLDLIAEFLHIAGFSNLDHFYKTVNENVYELVQQKYHGTFELSDKWAYTKISRNTIRSSDSDTIIKKQLSLSGEQYRFAFAWWTDPTDVKIFRIFGDRIKLNKPRSALPRLFPFGLNPYHVVYPDSKADPDRCSKCDRNIRNDLESFHTEDPPRFLCASCKYLEDTGFKHK